MREQYDGLERREGGGGARATFIAMAFLMALDGRPAYAACNLIPQTTKIFDGVVGTANRPFAGPGEALEVTVRPCDGISARVGPNPSDQLVTVLFTPNGGATRNAIVLTAGSCGAIASELDACHSQLGGGQVGCVEGSTAGLRVVERPDGKHLQFRFPDSDAFVGVAGDSLTLAGPATIAVTRATASSLPCGLDQSAASCTATASSIPGLVVCIDELFRNDGACGSSQPHGIFNHFTALPYPNDFTAACINEAPPCNPTASQFRLTTDQAGNALLPMNWSGILLRPGGIPSPRLLSASLSSPQPITFPGQSFFASFSPDGGPLAPIFVPQFDPSSSSSVLSLFGSADAPYTVLRIARRSDNFEQCHGGINDGLPCNEPDDCPAQCSAGSSNAGQRCTTDAACPGGTCSVPSPGSCGPTVCAGGSNAGQPCTADSFCPNGECGPAVFTLTPLIYEGTGPVVLPRQPGVCASGMNSGGSCTSNGECPGSFCLTDGFCQEDTSQTCSLTNPCSSVPCVDFQMTAESPIPLASLAAQSANVFGLTSLEGVDNVDRNGDGDWVDAVVTLRDSMTGKLQSLGTPAECIGVSSLSDSPPPQGRAIVQLHQAPFVFPAVSTRGDLVAFLESEANEGNCDENVNAAVFDSILRVFRLGPTDLTTGTDETVEAAPAIGGKSLVISNGEVFFRHSETGRAQQQTGRVSVSSSEVQGNSFSGNPTLSADGRYVAFHSDADNLVPGDTNGAMDVLVHDRETGVTERVSVDSSGAQANGISLLGALSADGRYVAFLSDAPNLVPGDTNASQDVFVHDRVTGSTERASVDSLGAQENGISYLAALSADGRYVAFVSDAPNLVVGDTNGSPDVFVHDRLTGVTERVSVDSSGAEGNDTSWGPAISADGHYVAFYSYATNLVSGDTNFTADVFVHDRVTGVTERVSVDSSGVEANAISFTPALSADGRLVVFASEASNLIPGDTNALRDVFVHDRVTGMTERVSVDSSGAQGNGVSGLSALSADGRYVGFYSEASNLVPGDTNAASDIFVHDRLTGATQRVSVDSSGTAGNGLSYSVVLSADGRYVAFYSEAANLVPGDTNGAQDIFVRGPDPTDLANDLTGDGDLNDTVLGVLDTTVMSPTSVSLCPADQVSVAGGIAAFLRPENAGATPGLSNCPAGSAVSGGVDLNGNGTATDDVVHLALNATTIENLGLAATAVSLSGTCAGGAKVNRPCFDNSECPGSTCAPSFVAALVSEAGQNADLNNDGDKTDTVVEVRPAGSGSWSNLQQAADTVQIEGKLVALITPEASQKANLNGDGDKADRVLQIYDAATAQLINTKQAAEEFVIGTQPATCGNGPVVAFRTSEAAQGNSDLNGDSDKSDDVLQVYVPGVGVRNTREAVRPCNLEICDPRQPYLVQGDTVKFLTYEGDQSQDLNGNGTATDLILQIFDACSGVLTVVGAVDTTNDSANPLTNAGTTTQAKTVFATTAGVCVSGMSTLLVPAMCDTDADCPLGATCQAGNNIVAAPAAIPSHDDSVVFAPKPLTATIGLGRTSVAKTLVVKVRNGNVLPVRQEPGHSIQLTVRDGTCPAGTVAGLPDFDSRTGGAQDKILLKGGAAKTARVPLLVTASAVASVNRLAPVRCALAVSVATADVEGNIDPTSANDTALVELNMIDRNNPQASSPADAVILSAKPVQVTIGKHAATMSKTRRVPIWVQNADTATATLTVTADNGNCPAGTLSVEAPGMVTLAGGEKAKLYAQVTATNAAFLTANAKSPSRCTATLSVAGPGSDPDPTNNTTQMVISVTDREDF